MFFFFIITHIYKHARKINIHTYKICTHTLTIQTYTRNTNEKIYTYSNILSKQLSKLIPIIKQNTHTSKS